MVAAVAGIRVEVGGQVRFHQAVTQADDPLTVRRHIFLVGDDDDRLPFVVELLSRFRNRCLTKRDTGLNVRVVIHKE